MAQDKDFKRLIRQRLSETGERYTTARAALRTAEQSETTRDGLDEWLTILGDPQRTNEAFEYLQGLPADDCRRAALRGLRHDSWRTKHRCAQLLDDLALTDATIRALTDRLRDGHPGVRQAALHSLACEACKPEKCDIDVRSLAESMLSDPNAEVRRQAVGIFRRFDDQAAVTTLEAVAEKDVSNRVREAVNEVLRDKQQRRDGDAAREALPPELRAKTERHTGKWVAIADGRIISAHRFRGHIRRDMKGKNHPDALVVWVAESAG